MNVVQLAAHLLQSIPDGVRKVLVLSYAAAVVLYFLLEIWYTFDPRVSKTLLVIGGYLGIQSGANVLSPEELYYGEDPVEEGTY